MLLRTVLEHGILPHLHLRYLVYTVRTAVQYSTTREIVLRIWEVRIPG